jgi:ABC-type sugar transport system ATPase subunit
VVFDEPTRGVDVSAILQNDGAVRALAASGKSVWVISSYLPEILAISGRILVACGGRIAEEMSAALPTLEKILYASVTEL